MNLTFFPPISMVSSWGSAVVVGPREEEDSEYIVSALLLVSELSIELLPVYEKPVSSIVARSKRGIHL